LYNFQIGRGFFRALSVDCQQLVISAVVDVAVESTRWQTTSTTAVLCLKQVFTVSLQKSLQFFVLFLLLADSKVKIAA